MKGKELAFFIEEMLSKKNEIDAGVKVTSSSYIHDSTWFFNEELEHRPRSIGDGALRIEWHKWCFSSSLRKELQVILFLLWKAPSLFGKKYKKANSFCMVSKRGLDFLSAVVDSFPDPMMVQSVSDLELSDLSKVAASQDFYSVRHVKNTLTVVFSSFSSKFTSGGLMVSPIDIKRLNFKHRQPRRKRDDTQVMPDDLFSLLSDECSACVKSFLKLMGVAPEDPFEYCYSVPENIDKIRCFKKVFSLYAEIRTKYRNGVKVIWGQYDPLKKYAVSASEINAYLDEVNISAQTVLGLYMGARISELTSLLIGCRSEKDGVACLVGRNFKGKSDADPSSDTWVSIPIMNDAVAVLEVLAKIKNNKYLIAPMKNSQRQGRDGAADSHYGVSYSVMGFADAVNKLVRRLDKRGKFIGFKFTTHKFKHSLAAQMVKAKLGLPYISFHLKHLYSSVVSLPSEVTLGYGNARTLIQSDIAGVQLMEMKRQIAEQMLDPSTVLAGGAAKEFDERRRSFFTGMTDQGMSKEQIIDEVASLIGSSFVNVGLAYCTGRKKDPKTQNSPPCIGSLKCNPVSCHNAFVTQEHKPAWRRVYAENVSRCNDPRFAYAHDQFQQAASEARSVLELLGDRIDEKP